MAFASKLFANRETPHCKAIFNQTRAVRLVAAFWTKTLLFLGPAHLPLGNNTSFCSIQRHSNVSVHCFPELESGHFYLGSSVAFEVAPGLFQNSIAPNLFF